MCFVAIILVSCDDDLPETVYLRTELVGIYDITKKPEKDFWAIKEDGYYRCYFPTVYIRKAQTIDHIDAKYVENKLYIDAHLDKDMFPEDLDRKTLVEFNLYGLPSGEYEVFVCVDGGGMENIEQKTWLFE